MRAGAKSGEMRRVYVRVNGVSLGHVQVCPGASEAETLCAIFSHRSLLEALAGRRVRATCFVGDEAVELSASSDRVEQWGSADRSEGWSVDHWKELLGATGSSAPDANYESGAPDGVIQDLKEGGALSSNADPTAWGDYLAECLENHLDSARPLDEFVFGERWLMRWDVNHDALYASVRPSYREALWDEDRLPNEITLLVAMGGSVFVEAVARGAVSLAQWRQMEAAARVRRLCATLETARHFGPAALVDCAWRAGAAESQSIVIDAAHRYLIAADRVKAGSEGR